MFKLTRKTVILSFVAALLAAGSVFAAQPTSTRIQRPLQGNVSKPGGFRIPVIDNSLRGGVKDKDDMQGDVNDRDGSQAGAVDRGAFDRNLTGAGATLDLGDQSFTLNDQFNILAKRNICVVVDRSTSMKEDDCPGDMSRWEWCQNQAQYFSQQTAGVLREGITLALFSRDFDIYPNVTVDQVRYIFARTKCKMGTHPERPLRAILSSYFSGPRSKPLSIAVVSDGEPNDPEDLAQLITEATWQMTNPDQVSITFLQVGHEGDGTKILNALDNYLVRQGAKYDIVDHRSFNDLQRMGLMGAIVASVQKAAPTPKFAKSAPARKRANPAQPPRRR